MAWIRLSDDYNDHPKFNHLSDGAFRLWHQVMGYCRKFKTDGMIPARTIREFRAYRQARMTELTTPWQDGEQPLWHVVSGGGVNVHDYLEWNPSKEEENERRADSKERMRVLRESRLRPVSTNNVLTAQERSQNVPGWVGNKKLLEKKSGSKFIERDPAEDALIMRAGALLTRYEELFYENCQGARYQNRMHLDFEKAMQIVRTWPDDARLEKLAVLVLTTDNEWISNTDRGFGIFALKASWADLQLVEWEAKRKAK